MLCFGPRLGGGIELPLCMLTSPWLRARLQPACSACAPLPHCCAGDLAAVPLQPKSRVTSGQLRAKASWAGGLCSGFPQPPVLQLLPEAQALQRRQSSECKAAPSGPLPFCSQHPPASCRFTHKEISLRGLPLAPRTFQFAGLKQSREHRAVTNSSELQCYCSGFQLPNLTTHCSAPELFLVVCSTNC